ncbi:MAG: Vps62-related protein [Dehalococcoidia bacterium]
MALAVLAVAIASAAGSRVWPPALAAASPASECVVPGSNGCESPRLSLQEGTAEEQLAAKYAPIVYLRVQPDPCEPEGFQPMPVEVVLGNPRVTLVRPGPDGRSVQPGPTAADLYRARDDIAAYLDLPGRPGNPGCIYIRDFKTFGAGTPAVTYAHIEREKGYLALQYWFYYYFNDWNNQHESDWEMIQLLFRADSAAEALEQDPARVSFAQHSGGETAEWNDKKLRREGDHPIVYVSGGSHASYFEPKVYLGLGEAGSGLGCDDASRPARRVPLEVRLVPAEVNGEDDPFAWSVFQGRWGEHHPGQNNGPTGPNTKPRWTQPVTHFDENILDYNLTVPRGTTLGPNAVDVFCGVVGFSGRVLGLYYESPVPVALTGAALALIAGTFLTIVTRATFFATLTGATAETPAAGTRRREPVAQRSAVSLYARHLVVFLSIGAVFIPIGVVAALVNGIHLEVGDVEVNLSLLLGGLPLLLAFVVVNAAVAAVLRELDAGHRPAALDGYRAVWTHLRALLWSRLKALGIVSLLLISVVGIPFAVIRMIRWLFVEQAIMIDDAGSQTALAASARVVKGRWWRTLASAVVLGFIGLMTGPVVAITMLILFEPPAELVNVVSSAIYALMLPLVFIALTQLYTNLKARTSAE